ncbi:MAG: Ig-like domain-containing protein, partial [Epsilonproteobacteria bacterium]|nr:Ig-like domain-containing protein [Campylobacterota bacterium]
MLRYTFISFLLLLLVGCNSSETSSGDAKPQFSISRSPINSTPISINQKIVLQFTSLIDDSTVNGNSVYILDETNASVGLVLEIGPDETQKDKIALTPYEYFKPSSRYTIVVTPALQDKYGRSLAREYRFEFSTLADLPDNTPLGLRAITPQNGATDVLKQSSITLDFNKSISAAPAYDGQNALVVRADGAAVSGSYEVFNSLLTFTPNSPLPLDSNITVALSGSISDLYSNQYSTAQSWWFKTRSATNDIGVNQNYKELARYESNEPASLVRGLFGANGNSFFAVASGSEIDIYEVDFSNYPSIPQIRYKSSFSLASGVESMVAIGADRVVAGTQSSGIYSLMLDANATLKEISHINSSEA